MFVEDACNPLHGCVKISRNNAQVVHISQYVVVRNSFGVKKLKPSHYDHKIHVNFVALDSC
jgi:hypothetical protein